MSELVLYSPANNALIVYQGQIYNRHLYWLLPREFVIEQIWMMNLGPKDWKRLGLIRIGKI